jgi:hypothetical protein
MKRKKFDNVRFALDANAADAIAMTMWPDIMTSIETAVGS